MSSVETIGFMRVCPDEVEVLNLYRDRFPARESTLALSHFTIQVKLSWFWIMGSCMLCAITFPPVSSPAAGDDWMSPYNRGRTVRSASLLRGPNTDSGAGPARISKEIVFDGSDV
jgi:hypothetical protein